MTKIYLNSFHSGGISWTASNAEAQTLGGHLATISDSTEDNLLDSLGGAHWLIDPPAGKTYLSWIGGFQPDGSSEPSGGFAWVTGEPFTYTNWFPGDPDNLGPGGVGNANAIQLAAVYGTLAPHYWNDVNVNNLAVGYLAEFDSDNVHGSSSDDNILVASGTATVDGGAGNDSIAANTGDDSLYGGAGNDTLNGKEGNDSLDGGLGNDGLNGGDGNDTITGGGDATNASGPGVDFLRGNAGNDSLIGGTDNEDLVGDDGDDTLISGGGNNDLGGGTGNDVYQIAAGFGNITISDTLGSDIDTIRLIGIDSSHIRMWTDSIGALNIQDTADTSHNIHILQAGSGLPPGFFENVAGHYVERIVFDDGTIIDLTNGLTLTGTTEGDGLNGSDKGDTIQGLEGNDTLEGFDGNDSLDGGIGADSLAGGVGDDVFRVNDSGDVVYETKVFGTNNAGIDTVLAEISHYVLPKFVENLIYDGTGTFDGVGNTIANALTGGASNDTLSGLTGNDSLDGLGGTDSLDGGAGNDQLDGGSGDDTLVAGKGADHLSGGDGSDSLSGDAGADTLLGGLDNDVLAGGDANDSVAGGEGNDTIEGGIGGDKLFGENGDDSIAGGDSNDTITGGEGADVVRGELGADRFAFALGDLAPGPAFDEIADFSHAEKDKIDLSAIDAIPGGADNKFAFIGAAAFSHVAGQLHYVVSPGGGVIVEGDTDGDGAADFHIAVDGVTSLIAADFAL